MSTPPKFITVQVPVELVRLALECEHEGAARYEDGTAWCGGCGATMTETGPGRAEEWMPPVLIDRLETLFAKKDRTR